MCEQGTAHETIEAREIFLLGRAVTFIRRGWKCDRCGERYHDGVQAQENERAEAEAKAIALRHVDGAALRAAREEAGLTQPALENIIGLGRNVVARWETGARPLPEYIATIVRIMALRPNVVHELAAIRNHTSGERP